MKIYPVALCIITNNTLNTLKTVRSNIFPNLSADIRNLY